MKIHLFSVHCKKLAMGIDLYRKLQSLDQAGSEKKNWNRKSKIVFLESLLKTVSRVPFSFFDIPSLDGGKGR